MPWTVVNFSSATFFLIATFSATSATKVKSGSRNEDMLRHMTLITIPNPNLISILAEEVAAEKIGNRNAAALLESPKFTRICLKFEHEYSQ